MIHLWDLNHEGTWEGKGTYVYYTDFVMELTLLSLDLMHHIHMLVSFLGERRFSESGTLVSTLRRETLLDEPRKTLPMSAAVLSLSLPRRIKRVPEPVRPAQGKFADSPGRVINSAAQVNR